MTKLDAGLMTSLPASDPGSTAVWGSKRINPRPQSCLCLAWSGCPSNDDDDFTSFHFDFILDHQHSKFCTVKSSRKSRKGRRRRTSDVKACKKKAGKKVKKHYGP